MTSTVSIRFPSSSIRSSLEFVKGGSDFVLALVDSSVVSHDRVSSRAGGSSTGGRGIPLGDTVGMYGGSRHGKRKKGKGVSHVWSLSTRPAHIAVGYEWTSTCGYIQLYVGTHASPAPSTAPLIVPLIVSPAPVKPRDDVRGMRASVVSKMGWREVGGVDQKCVAVKGWARRVRTYRGKRSKRPGWVEFDVRDEGRRCDVRMTVSWEQTETEMVVVDGEADDGMDEKARTDFETVSDGVTSVGHDER